MNPLQFKLFSKPRMAALVLATGSAFGLLAACGNDSNSIPSTPIVNTGGGGSGGSAGGSVAGGEHSAGDNGAGDSNASAGSTQGGSANGVAAGAAGEAGEGGAAGSTGGTPVSCPTSDVGFYNQTSASQRQPFNDVQRLGTHTALPTLPGG